MKRRLLLACALALLAGCQGGGGSNPAPAASTAPASSAAESPRRSVTLPLEFGQAPCRVEVGSLKRDTGGRIVVRLTVTNLSQMPTDVTVAADLMDDQGRRFSAEEGTLDDVSDTLQPTESGWAVLRFKLPAGATGAQPRALWVWDGVNPSTYESAALLALP
jgi:hypothetical protein